MLSIHKPRYLEMEKKLKKIGSKKLKELVEIDTKCFFWSV